MKIFLTEKEFLTILSKVFISFELMVTNNIAINREAESGIKLQKAREIPRCRRKFLLDHDGRKELLKKAKNNSLIHKKLDKNSFNL